MFKYDKDIMIWIDHEFTRLYLLSGRRFEKGEVPDYLTAILKTDTDDIFKLAAS